MDLTPVTIHFRPEPTSPHLPPQAAHPDSQFEIACSEVVDRLERVFPEAESRPLREAARELLRRFMNGSLLDLTNLSDEGEELAQCMTADIWADLELQAMALGAQAIESVVVGADLSIDENMADGLSKLLALCDLTVSVAADARVLPLGVLPRGRLEIHIDGAPGQAMEIVVPPMATVTAMEGSGGHLLESKVWTADSIGKRDEAAGAIPLGRPQPVALRDFRGADYLDPYVDDSADDSESTSGEEVIVFPCEPAASRESSQATAGIDSPPQSIGPDDFFPMARQAGPAYAWDKVVRQNSPAEASAIVRAILGASEHGHREKVSLLMDAVNPFLRFTAFPFSLAGDHVGSHVDAMRRFELTRDCLKEIVASPLLSESDKKKICFGAGPRLSNVENALTGLNKATALDAAAILAGILEADAKPGFKLELLRHIRADGPKVIAALQQLRKNEESKDEDGKEMRHLIGSVWSRLADGWNAVHAAADLLRGARRVALADCVEPCTRAKLRADQAVLDAKGRTLLLCSGNEAIPGLVPSTRHGAHGLFVYELPPTALLKVVPTWSPMAPRRKVYPEPSTQV